MGIPSQIAGLSRSSGDDAPRWIGPPVPSSPGAVLLVTDDPISRHLMQRLLRREGYEVLAVSSAEDAYQVGPDRFPGFLCLVTDYGLPGASGLDLRAWLWLRDPSIASVLVTAGSERQAIEQIVRAGFVDFLAKPVDAGDLRRAVSRAVASTRHQREVLNLERDVEEVGRVQRQMIFRDAKGARLHPEVYLRPCHSAGGDFLAHIAVSNRHEVLVLADVSGHDLNASYTAAFFQGMVRGMLESGVGHEQALRRFNRFLTSQWSPGGEERMVSISASSLSVDASARTVSAISCGGPLPVFTCPDGISEVIPQERSEPLGWFEDNRIRGCVTPVRSGHFVLWTDGVEDVAGALKITPLSLAHTLVDLGPRGAEPVWLRGAGDDMIAVRLEIGPQSNPHDCARCVYRALVVEHYRREDISRIDEMQLLWSNSVLHGCSWLTGDVLYDALLCAREALLNALQHGCAADQSVQFQISSCANARMLRVFVSDPGPGHDFDPSSRVTDDSLPEGHRGLVLMESLTHRLQRRRRGAELTMDFFVSGEEN